MGYPNETQSFFQIHDRYLQKGLLYILLFSFGLAVLSSVKCTIYIGPSIKKRIIIKNIKHNFNNFLLVTNIQHNFLIQKVFMKLQVKRGFRLKLEFWFWLGCFFNQQVKKFDQKRQLEQILTIFCQKVKNCIKKGLNIRSIARMALVVCNLKRLSKIYVQMLLIQCCQEFFWFWSTLDSKGRVVKVHMSQL